MLGDKVEMAREGTASREPRPKWRSSAERRAAVRRAKESADNLVRKLKDRLARLSGDVGDDVELDAEVERRETISRPALRRRCAGQRETGSQRIRRNVAQHSLECPPISAPLSEFRSAQPGARLGDFASEDKAGRDGDESHRDPLVGGRPRSETDANIELSGRQPRNNFIVVPYPVVVMVGGQTARVTGVTTEARNAFGTAASTSSRSGKSAISPFGRGRGSSSFTRTAVSRLACSSNSSTGDHNTQYEPISCYSSELKATLQTKKVSWASDCMDTL